MRLVVISHKLCWPSPHAKSGFVTDGGFPRQMEAISELFSATAIMVPCENLEPEVGMSPLQGRSLSVVPLSAVRGKGLARKLDMLRWAVVNGPSIWRSIRNADAVHTPIPGDVGTIGMVMALIQKKPLFVRHCGNWLKPRTIAERLWKYSMEVFAGSRNVMFATGGSDLPPSKNNPNIKWIFSTSLRDEKLAKCSPQNLSESGAVKLLIACRQEKNKGTDIVISALPKILESIPDVSLDVIGGGSMLESLMMKADRLGVGNRVVFHGRVEQAKVLSLMKRAHVFCYPTTASEGFPKVVLEALASGLPVVTTRVSVLPKLMLSGCGVLLNEAEPEQLAAAVISICEDSANYDSMSKAAIEVAREYSLERWRDFIGESLRRSWQVNSLSNGTGVEKR